MHRRTLLVSLAAMGALVGCNPKGGDLELICDPDLGEAVRRALEAYRSSHPDAHSTTTEGAPTVLLNLAEADGARVLITRALLLADNLQRTRRAPLENRWTLASKAGPIAVVATKGAGEGAAKAFAEWLAGPDGQPFFKPVSAP